MATFNDLPLELRELILDACIDHNAMRDPISSRFGKISYTHQCSELSALMNVALVSRAWMQPMIKNMQALAEWSQDDNANVSRATRCILGQMLCYLRRWASIGTGRHVPEFGYWTSALSSGPLTMYRRVLRPRWRAQIRNGERAPKRKLELLEEDEDS